MFNIIISLLLATLASMPLQAEFRDPTQPAYLPPGNSGATTIESSELVLSAIWISKRSRRATINGVTGKQGQTINVPIFPPAGSVTVPVSTTPNAEQDEPINEARRFIDANRTSMNNVLTPLLGSANKQNLTEFLVQNQPGHGTETTRQTVTSRTPASTPAIPPPSSSARPSNVSIPSSKIKILNIRKNAVTIEQNGELKILELIPRSHLFNTASHPR